MSLFTLRKLFTLPFFVGIAVGAMSMTAGASLLGSSVFSDVQPGSYYDAAVGRLYEQGVIKGSNGRFNPGEYVNRAEIAVMLDRALNGSASAEASGSSRSSRSRSSESSVSSSSSVSSTSSSSTSSVTSSSSSSSQMPVGEAGAFRFAVDKITISEASANLSLSIIRYSGKKGDVSVKFKTGDGSAKAGVRFNESSGVVSFKDGETTKLISMKLINNLLPEPNETFTIALSDATGGAVLGSPVTTTITILDNDGGGGNATSSASSSVASGSPNAASTVTFSAWEYAADESAGAVTVTVLRKGDTAGEAKINYTANDGTAQSGTHYAATQGTPTFASGETSKTFSVQINDNTSIEGNRKVNLKLNTPINTTLETPNTVPLTIVDNEATPTGSGSLAFANESYYTTEKQTSVVITVLRRGGYTGTVTVKYQTSDSTSTANVDYTSVTGTLTFAPGESAKSFSIPVIKDALVEGEEKVNLILSEPSSGATLGILSNSLLKISDQ